MDSPVEDVVVVDRQQVTMSWIDWPAVAGAESVSYLLHLEPGNSVEVL